MKLSYDLLGLTPGEILEVQNAESVSLQSLQAIAKDGLLQKARYINSTMGKKDYNGMTDEELKNSTSKGSAFQRISNMVETVKQHNDNQPDNSDRFFLSPSLIFKLTNSNFKIINNYFEIYRNMIDDANSKYHLTDKDNRKGKGYDFRNVLERSGFKELVKEEIPENPRQSIEENQPKITSIPNQEIKPEDFVDLEEILNKILNSPVIIESAKKQRVIIKASHVSNKIPSLKSLGDLLLFSIGLNKQGNLQASTICLYRDGQKAVFCLPDLNLAVTDELILESFKTGKLGYCVATNRDKTIRLKCAIKNSHDHLIELEYEDKLGYEGIAEKLDISWLEERPITEIPLKTLQINVIYTITGIGKTTKNYNTPLVDVKDELGNKIFNVITNSFLARYADKIGKKFKIVSIVEETQKIKGKPQKITKVNVLPLDGKDFSSVSL